MACRGMAECIRLYPAQAARACLWLIWQPGTLTSRVSLSIVAISVLGEIATHPVKCVATQPAAQALCPPSCGSRTRRQRAPFVPRCVWRAICCSFQLKVVGCLASGGGPLGCLASGGGPWGCSSLCRIPGAACQRCNTAQVMVWCSCERKLGILLFRRWLLPAAQVVPSRLLMAQRSFWWFIVAWPLDTRRIGKIRQLVLQGAVGAASTEGLQGAWGAAWCSLEPHHGVAKQGDTRGLGSRARHRR